jgi:hypothetical protein
MKNKIIIFGMVLLIILSACGSNDNDNNEKTNNSNEQTAVVEEKVNVENDVEETSPKEDESTSEELPGEAENTETTNEAEPVVEEPSYDALPVGAVITFGTYEQNNDGGEPEPIEWIVVEDKENVLTLLSKNILDTCYYNEDDSDYSWENSVLRKFLNSDFYNTAFSEDEKTKIMPTENTDSYGATIDNVFTFSRKELLRVFPLATDKEYLMASFTDYAYSHDGMFAGEENGIGQWHLLDALVEESGDVSCGFVTVTGTITATLEPEPLFAGVRPMIRIEKEEN